MKVPVTLLISISLLGHLVLPLVFLWSVAFSKGRNKLYRLSVLIFVGSFLVTMWLAGAGWGWFGNWWPRAFLILFIPSGILLFKNLNQVPWFPEKKFRPWFGVVGTAMLAIIFLMGIPQILASRDYEGEALRLTFPLQNGTYHIGHGGSSKAVNHHFGVLAQKYALDILKVNQWGIRAKGLLPTDLNAYEIFGDKVFAPCAGEVTSVEADLVDNTPPQMDSKNLLGNHVTLFCQGYSVLLAHLKKGSVRVRVGDEVAIGAYLADVGNTGNTSEPHLHIHAVKGNHTTKEEIAKTAEGVPLLFDGKFLIRNDRVTYLEERK